MNTMMQFREMVKSATDYLQAPWRAPMRKQMQMLGSFLLALVSVAIVAGIYLNVSTRAATMGREIQEMQVRMAGYRRLESSPDPAVAPVEELEQRIASLEAQLALLTSYAVLQQRAEQLGFEPATPEEMLYLEVTGYVERQEAVLAPPPNPVVVSAAGISPEFRQSLVDWFREQAVEAAGWRSWFSIERQP
jgi:hypothetical protein